MSRIIGIEVKVQKEVLQTRKYGLNEILKKKNENQSTNSKDDAEKYQIKELLHKLPRLEKIFEVHRKIGEGTFSSVYLGSLRQHANLPETEKRWFAIKHLVPTAHPARIEHELRCLQDMGGKHHVIGVDLCLRNLDTIVFVMPYIPHKKFSDYYGDMDAEELRQYMRALFIALRHVHSFGVIHRDVKPSNFLYDRDNRRYLLVDFGLAQRLCPVPEECVPPPAHSNNLKKRTREEEEEATSSAKRMALDLSTGRPVASSSGARAEAGGGARGEAGGGARGARCACAGLAGVCGDCAARPAPRAPRAGTQGFRPPEVLLKCPQQTTAVDVWAGGVVLASALARRYPLFRAADDVSALAELGALLGAGPLRRAAARMRRRLLLAPPPPAPPGPAPPGPAPPGPRALCLRRLAARLRRLPPPAPPCGSCPPRDCLCPGPLPPERVVAGRWVAGFPDSAFALAARLLDPDPRTRISAAEVLEHPFITEDHSRPPPAAPATDAPLSAS